MSSDGYTIVAHYQKAIKKARSDETKLLHCIGKLFELPITIEHLQRTGVGKTVNSLRKYDGEVGTAAKALVAKWKTMVANVEISDKQEEQSDVVDELVRSEMKVKNCELSVVNDIHPRSSKSKDRRLSAEKNTLATVSKNKDHADMNAKEQKDKDRKRKSKHLEKHNSKSKSTLDTTTSLKGNEDNYRQPHKNRAASSESHGRKEKEVSMHLTSPKAKKPKILLDEGIDSSMGASFSDALGMCSITNNKKHKKTQKSLVGTIDLEEAVPSRTKTNKLTTIPDALKTLPQSKLDIIANLPLASSVAKITDNYKPAPINQNVMNCIYPSTNSERITLANADALSVGISSKTMRTKVYSGIKTGALLSVPSLFDICIRVLQKNIDALEYTGGVPFDVLRPVLDRTTPQQLLAFEDYNAYLLDDTDILWEQHCKRHFRGQTKQEGESWREMFLRCEREKECRLNILTKNIKISQKQSALPVKKTRLAYVDNVVKPPRNIQRKQEIYKTNEKPIASPAARVAALSSASHNTLKAGDPRLKVSREMLQPGGNLIRPKKAPLMAKTLQFIKKRYKR